MLNRGLSDQGPPDHSPVDEEEVPRREAGLTALVRENREISGCLQGWPRPLSSPPEMKAPHTKPLGDRRDKREAQWHEAANFHGCIKPPGRAPLLARVSALAASDQRKASGAETPVAVLVLSQWNADTMPIRTLPGGKNVRYRRLRWPPRGNADYR